MRAEHSALKIKPCGRGEVMRVVLALMYDYGFLHVLKIQACTLILCLQGCKKILLRADVIRKCGSFSTVLGLSVRSPTQLVGSHIASSSGLMISALLRIRVGESPFFAVERDGRCGLVIREVSAVRDLCGLDFWSS